MIGGDDPSGSMMEVNEAVRRPISRDLVVVSAYRPNKEGTGESTVWAQHRLYFNSIKRKVDPRKALVDDLCKQIQHWRDEGCEVVLGVDANEDLSILSPESIRQRFWEWLGRSNFEAAPTHGYTSTQSTEHSHQWHLYHLRCSRSC